MSVRLDAPMLSKVDNIILRETTSPMETLISENTEALTNEEIMEVAEGKKNEIYTSYNK